MAIQCICPKCGKELNVPGEFYQKRIRCPGCSNPIKVMRDSERNQIQAKGSGPSFKEKHFYKLAIVAACLVIICTYVSYDCGLKTGYNRGVAHTKQDLGYLSGEALPSPIKTKEVPVEIIKKEIEPVKDNIQNNIWADFAQFARCCSFYQFNLNKIHPKGATKFMCTARPSGDYLQVNLSNDTGKVCLAGVVAVFNDGDTPETFYGKRFSLMKIPLYAFRDSEIIDKADKIQEEMFEEAKKYPSPDGGWEIKREFLNEAKFTLMPLAADGGFLMIFQVEKLK